MSVRPARAKPYEVPKHILDKLIKLKGTEQDLDLDERLIKIKDAHKHGLLYELEEELKGFNLNNRVYIPGKIPLNTSGRLYDIKDELNGMMFKEYSMNSSSSEE